VAQGWDDLYRKYQRIYDRMKSSESMKTIGEFAAEKIRTRTLTGYGVPETGASKQKLEPLSEKYIAARENFKGLSSNTRAGSSNLTRTGQMLDSIGVTQAGEGKATISVIGSRDDGKSNREIAKFQHDGIKRKKGGAVKRPFLRLSDAELKQIQNFIRKAITTLLKSGS
jgi:hypothetical protein